MSKKFLTLATISMLLQLPYTVIAETQPAIAIGTQTVETMLNPMTAEDYQRQLAEFKATPNATLENQGKIEVLTTPKQVATVHTTYYITKESHPAHPATVAVSISEYLGEPIKGIVVFYGDASKTETVKEWAAQY